MRPEHIPCRGSSSSSGGISMADGVPTPFKHMSHVLENS